MKKLIALLLALAMVFALCACGDSNADNTGSGDPAPTGDNESPAPNGSENPPAGSVVLEGTMNQVVTVNLLGNDIPVDLVRNFDTGAFRLDYKFNGNPVFAEGFVLEDGTWEITDTNNDFTFGTIEAVIPVIDDSAWTASGSELVVEVPVVEEMGDPIDRAEYGIPTQYTKAKIFVGTYGFGDAEIVAAFTEDETGFYLTFVCFDETQIVEGTLNNGIAMVTYDRTGFMSADAQLICDDAFASNELWCPLTGEPDSEDTPIDETPVAQTVTVDMMGNATEVYVVKTGNHFEMSYSMMGNDVVLTGSVSGDTWTFESSSLAEVAAFAGNIVNSVVAALDESAWVSAGASGTEPNAPADEPDAPVDEPDAPAAEGMVVTVELFGDKIPVTVILGAGTFELNYVVMGNDVFVKGTIGEDSAWTMTEASIDMAANMVPLVQAACNVQVVVVDLFGDKVPVTVALGDGTFDIYYVVMGNNVNAKGTIGADGTWTMTEATNPMASNMIPLVQAALAG